MLQLADLVLLSKPMAISFSLLTDSCEVKLFFFWLILLQTLQKIQKPVKLKAMKSQALWKTNAREPSTMRRQDCRGWGSKGRRWNLFEWTWPRLAGGQRPTSPRDLTEHSVLGTRTSMCWNPCWRGREREKKKVSACFKLIKENGNEKVIKCKGSVRCF